MASVKEFAQTKTARRAAGLLKALVAALTVVDDDIRIVALDHHIGLLLLDDNDFLFL